MEIDINNQDSSSDDGPQFNNDAFNLVTGIVVTLFALNDAENDLELDNAEEEFEDELDLASDDNSAINQNASSSQQGGLFKRPREEDSDNDSNDDLPSSAKLFKGNNDI